MGVAYEMLECLLKEARLLGRPPKDRAELAERWGCAPSNVSQIFGRNVDHPPKKPEVREAVCRVFNDAGVMIQPQWFDLSIDDFRKNVRGARAGVQDDWDPAFVYNFNSRLSELGLHGLITTNKPGTFDLSMTLRFGFVVEPMPGAAAGEDGVSHQSKKVLIALKTAELAVDSPSYQLVPLDVDAAGTAHCERVSGGAIKFTPKERGYLEGAPLQKLLKIQHYGPPQEEEKVTVTVRFPLLVFALTEVTLGEPPSASVEVTDPGVQGVLRAFYRKIILKQKKLQQQDDDECEILSRVILQRQRRRDAEEF
jgi:hypothetical protein